jgi:hypothetical protein
MRLLAFGTGWTLPSLLYVSPRGTERYDVECAIEPPPTSYKTIDRLKEWVIERVPEEWPIDTGGGPRAFRKVQPDQALEKYLELLFSRANVERGRGGPLWFLLPSIHDDDQHNRYRNVLRDSARKLLGTEADIRFMFEPDATLEYFRLVRRDIMLRPRENDLFLVVDCGAFTCNLTLVMSTRGASIATGTHGHNRSSLHPVADSARGAGRLVDEKIWSLAPDTIREAFPNTFIVAEEMKLAVATSSQPRVLRGPINEQVWRLAPEALEKISVELWKSYRPTLDGVLARGYEQLASNEKYKQALAARGVTAARELVRELQAIVLAGGTSRLPGFERALLAELDIGDRADLAIVRVGAEYPFVAAAGAMAHILRDRQQHSRSPESEDEEDASVAGDFVPGLPDDIYVYRRGRRDGREEVKVKKLVSRKDWPHAFRSGAPDAKSTGLFPPEWRGRQITYALGWGPNGAATNDFLVADGRSPWRMAQLGNQSQWRVEAAGDDSGGDILHFSIASPGERPTQEATFVVTPASQPRDGAPKTARAEPGTFLPSVSDVVVDFGMSKTVVAIADADDRIDASDFARLGEQTPRPTLPLGWTVNAPEDDAADHAQLRRRIEETVSAELPAAGPAPPTPPSTELPSGWEGSDGEFAFLKHAHAQMTAAGFAIHFEDVVAVHLAAKVRPLVLFAGPPGAGKSSLGRFYSSALGCSSPGKTLHIVAVQPHWTSDEPLLSGHPNRSAVLAQFFEQAQRDDLMQCIVMEEMNLTRPEYYLTRLFTALDNGGAFGDGIETPLPTADGKVWRFVIFGTLNIDEMSRPPADKVIDRAFILQRPAEISIDDYVTSPTVRVPERRVTAQTWHSWCAIEESSFAVPRELHPMIRVLERHASTKSRSLHESLVPSRRSILDICRFVAYRDRIPGLDESGFSRTIAMDAAVAARILPRFRGEEKALRSLLAELKEFFATPAQPWPRCVRLIASMENQLEDGFVSFWG